MYSRLAGLRAKMAAANTPALLVTGPENGVENLRYLSGFTGSSGVGLITPEGAWFFADPRYHTQAREECRGFEVVPCSLRVLPEALEKVKGLGVTELAVEKSGLLLGQYLEVKEALPNVTLTPVEGWVEELRQVKDANEVAAIRRACAVTDAAFEHILPCLREGVTEQEIAVELDFFCRRAGADRMGFDTIVAFGPHAALPHAHPGDRRLERGQFVLMDYGATLDGYNSDITRTVVFGPATERHRELYAVVLEAQRRALETLRPGLKGKEVDAAARDFLTERGYGAQFGHGLGHGLGRQVHDGGSFNTTSEITIEPGQVWTIEPGVYIEGYGGVRIEDDAVVTETSCDLLTAARKDLLIL